jgi:hypothetical protein
MSSKLFKSTIFRIMVGALIATPIAIHPVYGSKSSTVARKPWQEKISEKKREILLKALQVQNASADEIQALKDLSGIKVDEIFKEFKESSKEKHPNDSMSLESLSEDDVDKLTDEQIDQILKEDTAKQVRRAVLNKYLKQTQFKSLEEMKKKAEAQRAMSQQTNRSE